MINHDYYFYRDLYSFKDLHDINNILSSGQDSSAIEQQGSGKKVDLSVFPTSKISSYLERLYEAVVYTNRLVFDYDIFKDMPLRGHINRYHNNTNEYPWHRDCKNHGDKCDIKLTAILNISLESYKGGEFELFLGEGNISEIQEISNPGSLLIFPAFMFHRVKPVIEGSRTSMTIWFEGPGFK